MPLKRKKPTMYESNSSPMFLQMPDDDADAKALADYTKYKQLLPLLEEHLGDFAGFAIIAKYALGFLDVEIRRAHHPGGLFVFKNVYPSKCVDDLPSDSRVYCNDKDGEERLPKRQLLLQLPQDEETGNHIVYRCLIKSKRADTGCACPGCE
jgi:hypothetical protein